VSWHGCPDFWVLLLTRLAAVSALLVQVKGNVFKNKRVLIEAVHRQKAEKVSNGVEQQQQQQGR
jgi:hypothetical protein